MFTFIHAADIHLDSPLHKLDAYEGAPVEDFRLSTRRALENLVERTIADKADFLLIAGDLYDGDWKDYNTALFFIKQMMRLQRAGIRVFITAGNHDAASAITRTLRMPENVTLFPAGRADTVILEDLPVAIHGRSFATSAETSDLSLDYPNPRAGLFNIGILHTCAGGRPGHEPYAPCSPEGLKAKGFQYWALGHVHQYEVLSRDPLIVFPGTTQGRHIRETGPCGAVRVAVDGDMRPSLAFFETDVTRWQVVKVDAEEAEAGSDIIAAFSEQLNQAVSENSGRPLAVRAVVSGQTRAAGELLQDPERWTNEIRAAAMGSGSGRVWVEKVVFDCRPPLDAEPPPAAGAVSELAALFDEMEADPESRRELVSILAELSRKLPYELRSGPDAIRLEDPDGIGELLTRVRSDLMGRLMKREGGE